MRSVLLHVGPHKTGSTAIQRMLANNADALQHNGWHFETLSAFPSGVHGLADTLSMNHFDGLPVAMQKLADGPDRAIISSENLSRLNGEQAKRLIDGLPYDDVRVVYYLRNPLLRIQSAWRERVKHGYRYTLTEFVAGRLLTPFRDRELNDATRINPWIDAAGAENVDIHLYDAIADGGMHFFDTYLPEIEAPETLSKRVNKSPTVERIEVFRALAGYQVHLLGHRGFDDDIAEILGQIADIQRDTDQSYTRKLTLSLDTAILRRIEVELATLTGADGDRLFDARTADLDYLAPDIWFENPPLTLRLFTLREAIFKALGTPVFDQRLRTL